MLECRSTDGWDRPWCRIRGISRWLGRSAVGSHNSSESGVKTGIHDGDDGWSELRKRCGIRQRAVTYCCQDELLRGHEDTVGGGEPCLDGKTGLMMGFLSSDKINIYLVASRTRKRKTKQIFPVGESSFRDELFGLFLTKAL